MWNDTDVWPGEEASEPSHDSIDDDDDSSPQTNVWASRLPQSPTPPPQPSRQRLLRREAEAEVEEDEKAALLYPTPLRWDCSHPLDRALTAHSQHRLHSSALLSPPFYPTRATAVDRLQAEWFASSRIVSGRIAHSHAPLSSLRSPCLCL